MAYKSSYPPQFSSTLKYENRYDLDEIDVFLKGDGNNSMFFNIDKLPKVLGYGKYYFTISMKNNENTLYHLRNNSQVLFEFKSINNVIIESDVVNVDEKSGLIICYVNIKKDPMRTFKEIEDGEATFIIAAELTHNDGYNPIPKKWRDVINYKCTFPIEIRKKLSYTQSPTINDVVHKKVSFAGPFAFNTAHTSQAAGDWGYKRKGNGIIDAEEEFNDEPR